MCFKDRRSARRESAELGEAKQQLARQMQNAIENPGRTAATRPRFNAIRNRFMLTAKHQTVGLIAAVLTLYRPWPTSRRFRVHGQADQAAALTLHGAAAATVRLPASTFRSGAAPWCDQLVVSGAAAPGSPETGLRISRLNTGPKWTPCAARLLAGSLNVASDRMRANPAKAAQLRAE